MLEQNHILVVCTKHDDANCTGLVTRLKAMHATVHVTDSHTQALGTYWLLYDKQIYPRAVITDWYLTDPQSEQFKFYELLGKREDCTAKNLINNIRSMDRNVVIIVEADRVEEVPPGLADYVVQRPFQPKEMLQILMADPTIKKQKIGPGGLRTRSGLFTLPS